MAFLLLLIYCLLLFPFFLVFREVFLVIVLCALVSLLSSVAIILLGKRKLVDLIIFFMRRGFWCPVSFPNGVVGWSVVSC